MFVTDLLITDEQEGGLNEHYTLEEGEHNYEIRPGQYVLPSTENVIAPTIKVYVKVPNDVPENADFRLYDSVSGDRYYLSDFTEGEYDGGYTHCLELGDESSEGSVVFDLQLTVNNNTEEEGHPQTQTYVTAPFFGAVLNDGNLWINQENCSDQGPNLLDMRVQDSPSPLEVEGTTFELEGGVHWYQPLYQEEADDEYAITPCLKVYEVQSNSEDYLIGTSTGTPENPGSWFNYFTVDREVISDPDLRTGNYRVDIVNEGETIRSYKFSIIDKQPDPEEPGE